MLHRVATILLISLISPTSILAATQTQTGNKRPQTAGKFRSNADLAMSERRFDDAIKYYQQAIELEPENALNYFKLFRVHNRMNKLDNALSDLTTALEHDPSKDEYRKQRAKLLVSLGQCDRAVEDYKLMTSADASDKEKAEDCAQEIAGATQSYNNGKYEMAYHLLTSVLQKTERADDLLFMKADAAFHIGEFYVTVSDTARVLKNHGKHLDAYKLRGDAYYRLAENDLALSHYREALKFDPEHKGCKAGHKKVKALVKKVGRATKAMEEKRFEDALEFWRQAAALDQAHTAFRNPTILKIASCLSSLGKHSEAVKAVDEYMKNVGKSTESYLILGDTHMEADKFEEAVQAYRKAMEAATEGENTRHIQEKMQKAETALKQSKQKNYYKILEVSRTADKKTIKKSYRDLALKWHPDKNADNVEEAEKMFQDIGEAYEVLSTDELRGKYDRGEDVFENQGGGGGGHNPFGQHFQRGGGGQKFSFHFN